MFKSNLSLKLFVNKGLLHTLWQCQPQSGFVNSLTAALNSSRVMPIGNPDKHHPPRSQPPHSTFVVMGFGGTLSWIICCNHSKQAVGDADVDVGVKCRARVSRQNSKQNFIIDWQIGAEEREYVCLCECVYVTHVLRHLSDALTRSHSCCALLPRPLACAFLWGQ